MGAEEGQTIRIEMRATWTTHLLNRRGWAVVALLGAVGVVLLAAALPVRMRAVDPAQLAAAGRGSREAQVLAERYLESGRTGPVRLVWEAVPPGMAADPERRQLRRLEERRPVLRLTGGPAPFMEAILDLAGVTPGAAAGAGAGAGAPPVATLMLGADVRREAVAYLKGSSRPAVPMLLGARHLGGLSRLAPAGRPGGQVVEAVVCLLAVLAQGESLEPELLRELRLLLERAEAGETAALQEWEAAVLGVLSLAQRLDFAQVEEMLRGVTTPVMLADLGALARREPALLAQVLVAKGLGGEMEALLALLNRLGERGREALTAANRAGSGAVALVLERRQPVARVPPLARPLRRLGEALAPGLAALPGTVGLGIKLALAALAGFLALLGLRGLLPGLASATGGGRTPSALLGTSLFAFAVVLAEPDVFAAAPPPLAPAFQLDLAGLATVVPRAVSTMSIDQLTILAVLFFFIVQLGIFLLGLAKLGQLRRLDAPPEFKLKLLENEEHLFDFGLYVGLIGTASAFILLSLGIVEASIMAAYTSTLFGIVFVAVLKVTRVRPYRRTLIEEAAGR